MVSMTKRLRVSSLSSRRTSRFCMFLPMGVFVNGRVRQGAGCRHQLQSPCEALLKERLGETDQSRAFTAHMLANVLRIVGLEIEIMRLGKVNQNRHHFTQAQARGRPSLASHSQLPGILPCNQPLTEIIDMTNRLRILITEHLPLLENFCWRTSILPA